MSATITKIHEPSPEQKAEEWLAKAPAKYIACRGFGHAFPKPTDKRQKKNFRMTKDSKGSMLEMTCRDCGTVRYVTAMPGEIITLPAKRYGYDRPYGYSVPPGTGQIITRNRCANEAMRRFNEEQEFSTGGEEIVEIMEGKNAG